MKESTLYTEIWYTLKQVFSLNIQMDRLQLISKLLRTTFRTVNYNFGKNIYKKMNKRKKIKKTGNKLKSSKNFGNMRPE